MKFLVAAFVLLFCAPVLFVEARLIRPIFFFAVFSIVVGAVACSWPSWMPADFLVQHPALANTPLQPVMALFFGGILLLFGIELLLVIGARAIRDYYQAQKR